MPTPHQNPVNHEVSEEHLSAFFDRETPEQSLDMSTVEQVPADRRDELLRAWGTLGDVLRAIPVQPVVGLQRAVSEKIRAERAKQAAGSVVTIAERRDDSTRAFRWVGVAVSMAAVALFSLRLGLHQQPGVEDCRPDSSMVSRFADDLTVEPDWQIVVVTIDDQSADTTRQWLEATIRDQGLSALHRSGSQAGHPQFPLGILVASGSESAELVNSVSRRSHSSQLHMQWNPGYVGRVASGDVKMQFLRSMQTPTLSDEFFGQMYAVVPGTAQRRLDVADADSHIASARESSVEESDARIASSTDGHSSGAVAATGDDRTRTAGASRPVLVVFLQQSAGEQSVPVAPDQGQLTVPPADPAAAPPWASRA